MCLFWSFCLYFMTLYSLFPSQTFEAKLLHIESRPGRKSKNSTTDLDFFMKCEVHSSDLDVFINALKRVADDVRSIPEEKGNRLILFWHFSLVLLTFLLRCVHVRTPDEMLQASLEQLMSPYDNNMQPITKALIISFSRPHHSALVSPTDKRPRQMQHVNNQIWSWHGPGASGEGPHVCCRTSRHVIIILDSEEKVQPVYGGVTCFSAGIQRSRIQKKTSFHLWACIQIQTVSQIFKKKKKKVHLSPASFK